MNETQERIIELVGAYNWEQVEQEWDGMTADEIAEEVENCWPGDDGNAELARQIAEQLS